MTSNGANGVMDRSEPRRLRELYTYFNPESFFDEVHSDSVVAPDPVLAAQAQLLTLRFNVNRALINLIDAKSQYRLAEATQTSSLDDLSFSSGAPESQWVECRIGPRSKSLCQHTIEAVPLVHGEAPFFEVSDLSKDSKYAGLFYVAGPPYFKYYCGTPLLAVNNTPIGAICVLDDKPREPLSPENRAFLSTIARNVMTHLTLKRGDNEAKRVASMNRCLNSFVTTDFHYRLSRPVETNHVNEHGPDHAKLGQDSMHIAKGVSGASPDAPPVPEAACGDRHPFECAANLIAQALNLGVSGEVIFLDPVARTSDEHHKESRLDPEPESCSTLASFIGQGLQNSGSTSDDTPTHSLSVKELKSLIKDYPLGKVWNLGPDGEVLSQHSEKNTFLEEFEAATETDGEQKSESNARILRSAFPEAISLVFRPFWNSKTSRWIAGFAISKSLYRTLNSCTDVPYFIAFCNCISIELARISVDVANRRKGDFISSISHELRSPLHGILASCEFLQDTGVTSMQQSLLDTVNSCARTLLDTISMVLDYSKINKFESSMQSASGSSKTHMKRQASARSPADPSLLPNLYGTVDLVAIVEEVLEGAVVGQLFQNFQHTDVADIGAGARGLPEIRNASAKRLRPRTQMTTVTGKVEDLEVLLRIAVGEWTFVTQPGAFRRIVMNLVGNALKYTKVGYVHVEMELEECRCAPEKFTSSSGAWKNLKLTISDTGKGISDSYLSSHLFTPFSQEDSLSSGTGLGLSLVQSLLRMLEGQIDIRSKLGSGTTVQVTIPMCDGISGLDKSSDSTPSSNATPVAGLLDNSLEVLRSGGVRRVGLFQSKDQHHASADGGEAIASALHKNLQEYFVHWFQFEFYPQWSKDDTLDLIVTNDYDLERYLEKLEGSLVTFKPTPILVLCSRITRQHAIQAYDTPDLNIEFLWTPYGPYKLARAVQCCLEKRPLHPLPSPATSKRPIAASLPKYEDASTPTPVPMQQGKYKLIRSGEVIANEESMNAYIALRSLRSPALPRNPSNGEEDGESKGFPFPPTGESGSPSPKLRPANNSPPPTNSTKTPNQEDMARLDPAGILNKIPSASQLGRVSPRILVVDDNTVNLKLLRTFVERRNCERVATATDGLVAADIFRESLDAGAPFDIVFMDLSMPVLDGFESTRRIRALERECQIKAYAGRAYAPAMIIALTGLASDKDQFDAFDAGVDLYMTKPARFKEIRRLLDSWEANGAAHSRDAVPHGPVVGQRTRESAAEMSVDGAAS